MPFSDEVLARLDADAAQIIAPLPAGRASALLPLLHLVQSEEGYVSADGIEFCAEQLGLDRGRGRARWRRFYTMYKRRPVGDYLRRRLHQHAVRGAGRRRRSSTELHEHLGVGNDETTPDGKVTPGARRVQRGLRLRAGDDGQLGVLRQHDARTRPASSSTACGPGTTVAPTRGRRGWCTWREAARIAGRLRRRPGRTQGPAAGPADLVGPADRHASTAGPRRSRPRATAAEADHAKVDAVTDT